MKGSEKPTLAVALQYQGQAPEVVASGRGEVGEEILRIAQAHGIPVQEDPELVELLSYLEVGQAIPEYLYMAVAEVLAFAFLLNGRYQETISEGRREP